MSIGPGLSPRQVAALRHALDAYVHDPRLLSDLEGSGPVATLEREMAETCGTSHVLTVSSGTAALHTALLACGIGPGDEVVTSPYSWPQTVSPIVYTGATAVFADIDAQTAHIDPQSVRDRISERTKAVLVPHLFGHAAPLVALRKTCRNAGIKLIADGAQAFGTCLDGDPVAAQADVTCFSLGRGKLVSCGEGGLVATDDPVLYENAVLHSQHPERVRRMSGPCAARHAFGLNYRLHPLAALLASAGLTEYREKLAHRRTVHEAFRTGLGEGHRLSCMVPADPRQWTAYGIPLTNKGTDRTILVQAAQQCGVPLRCGPVRTPLHLRLAHMTGMPVTPHASHAAGQCPVAEMRCATEELWAFSAIDMDQMSEDEAWKYGKIVLLLSHHHLLERS
jgi:dTDP-4-amino-4,6-dideoxygalactose transaminase